MNHEELIKMSVEDLAKHFSGLVEKSKTAEGQELQDILAEAEDVKAIIEDATTRKKMAQMAAIATPATENGLAGEAMNSQAKAFENRGQKVKNGEKVQYAASKLSKKIKNSMTVDDTAPVVHTASDVKETFNDVSSLIDRVKAVMLQGGETYQRGFTKSYGNGGGVTAEGAAASTNEPEFGYVTITKEKVTAYAEEPEEMAKLPNADYDGIIEDSVTRAVRRSITRQIVNGNGASGTIKGIFYNPSSATDDVIDRDTDLSVAAIDEKTLDDIIYSYGGDEDVEAIAVLILNKKDLKAFATLRDNQDRKVYTVVNNGNTGTIDGVPYIINSACAAISDNNTEANAYCMAYGALENFELAVFSNIESTKSTDYKFKEGQIAYKAVTFVGGAVVAYNGFIRVKKGSF